MKCEQCGQEIKKHQGYCSACGAEAPQPKPKKASPIIIVLCAVLALSVIANIILVVFSRPSEPQKYEGDGFDSPEEAIVAYVDAMREGDIEKMLSTFAIESYVERFNFEGYFGINPSLSLAAPGLLIPNTGTYRPELNIHSRIYGIFSGIRMGYFALIDVNPNRTIHALPGDEQEETIEAITEELCGYNFDQNLARLKTGDILTGDDLDIDEENLQYFEELYLSYLDADEFCEIAIEVEFDGEDFLLYMTTVRINGRWYNMSLSATSGLQKGTLIGGFLKD